MALSTWLGVRCGDWHAAPSDAATPPMAGSSWAARTPSNRRLVVLGRRGASAPLTTVPGTASRTAASNRSRSASIRSASSAWDRRAMWAASPSPTTPGTLTVPPRIPASWPPPVIWGWSLTRGPRWRV